MKVVIPNVGESTRICLQTWMGTYVCAENGGGDLVVVNRPEAKEWETFELNRLDEDHITLKAHNGQYLCAENGGGTIIVANRGEAHEWEKFGLFIDHNGLVSLSVHNGQFLCAESTGVLMANRNEPKEWEAFRIVDPCSVESQERVVIDVELQYALCLHAQIRIDSREVLLHLEGDTFAA